MKRAVWLGLIGLVLLIVAAVVALYSWPSARVAVETSVGQRVLPMPPKVLAGVDLEVVGRGFTQNTDIQFVPGRPELAVILQKNGVAKVAKLAASAPAEADASPTLLQIPVHVESELGLLGLAFHPKFEQNGLFYLNYNPKQGKLRTRIAEWHVAPDAIESSSATEKRVILEVAQPFRNHNAGQLVFGPDGYLYIGLGDGGSAGDPEGNGQNLGALLGKMLRVDVDRKDPGLEYAVPPDNPFVKRGGARPEIWAYGIRNPWRYSFDPKGRLIVADVGQDAWEEITIVAAGENHGWRIREGKHCFDPKEGCRSEGLVDPIFEYGHDLGQSITGGYVYTGESLPALAGQYIFADFVTGRIWALPLPADRGAVEAKLLGEFSRTVATFGRDASGEIYAGDFATGEILKLVPARAH
jgi:glucose/arabinose dehydrogenase